MAAGVVVEMEEVVVEVDVAEVEDAVAAVVVVVMGVVVGIDEDEGEEDEEEVLVSNLVLFLCRSRSSGAMNTEESISCMLLSFHTYLLVKATNNTEIRV